jgi:hypothetical protein
MCKIAVEKQLVPKINTLQFLGWRKAIDHSLTYRLISFGSYLTARGRHLQILVATGGGGGHAAFCT